MPCIFNLRRRPLYARPVLPLVSHMVKQALRPHVWSAYEHSSDVIWPADSDEHGVLSIVPLELLWEPANGLSKFRTGAGLPTIITIYLDN